MRRLKIYSDFRMIFLSSLSARTRGILCLHKMKRPLPYVEIAVTPQRNARFQECYYGLPSL